MRICWVSVDDPLLSCSLVSQWHDVNAQSQSGTGKMVTSSSISILQRNNVKKEESQALPSCTPGCAKPQRTTPDFIMETLSLCFWHVDGTAVIQPGLTHLWESCFLPGRTENLAGLRLLRIGFRHPCPMWRSQSSANYCPLLAWGTNVQQVLLVIRPADQGEKKDRNYDMCVIFFELEGNIIFI